MNMQLDIQSAYNGIRESKVRNILINNDNLTIREMGDRLVYRHDILTKIMGGV